MTTELTLPAGPWRSEAFAEDLAELAEGCLRPFDPAQIKKKPQNGNQPGLDYVGHAHVTERLLKVDPAWNWEPAAWEDGRPKMAFDGRFVSMWIRLTLGGVTRLGVGTAEHRKERWVGPDGSKRKEDYANQEYEKELISDALRNAAMRFGIALELWAKGGLEGEGGAIGDGGQAPAEASARASARPGPAPTSKPSGARPTPAPRKSAPPKKPEAAPSPDGLDSMLVALPREFSTIPAPMRKEAMAALQASPSMLDSGPMPVWPLPTKGSKQVTEDGGTRQLTDEELMIVAADALVAIQTFRAEKKLQDKLGAEVQG